MRQFYLYPNASGYYNVIFIDPISGKKLTDKSTHTKDKVEAAMIATTWLQNGIPESRPNARNYHAAETKSNLNLKSIAQTVTEEEAQTLISMLTQ